MANITRIKAKDPRKKPAETPSDAPEKAAKEKASPVGPKPKKAAKPAAKPEKKPMGKFKRFITWPFRYIHESWLELRQVRWPSRGAAWKMVLAVLVYTALFVVIIMLLDALFTLIFSQILS